MLQNILANLEPIAYALALFVLVFGVSGWLALVDDRLRAGSVLLRMAAALLCVDGFIFLFDARFIVVITSFALVVLFLACPALVQGIKAEKPLYLPDIFHRG